MKKKNVHNIQILESIIGLCKRPFAYFEHRGVKQRSLNENNPFDRAGPHLILELIHEQLIKYHC